MRRLDADLSAAGAIGGAAIPTPVRRRGRLTRGSAEPTNNGRGRPTLRPPSPWWVFATNADGTSGRHRGARGAAGKGEPSRGPYRRGDSGARLERHADADRRVGSWRVRGATSIKKGSPTMTGHIPDAGDREIEHVGDRDFRFGVTGMLLMVAAALLLLILS
jgi:hypothetical protein